MNIEELMARVGDQATRSGFRTPGFVRSVAEHTALITTEVGELYEEHRDGRLPTEFWYKHEGRTGPDRYTRTADHGLDEDPPKPIGIPSELADIIIRVCDAADEWGVDLVRAIQEKIDFNMTRPLKHGRQS